MPQAAGHDTCITFFAEVRITFMEINKVLASQLTRRKTGRKGKTVNAWDTTDLWDTGAKRIYRTAGKIQNGWSSCIWHLFQ